MIPHGQLSPPWYTLWNEIKSSIGDDPAVTVNPLNTSQNPFIVPIAVSNNDKAVGIASIISLQHQLGNISVAVQVTNADGQIVTPVIPSSVEELVQLVQTALNGNSWFIEVIEKQIAPTLPVTVYPVFSKAVIQFYNDDLTDLYSNYNNVAAFVFKNVLNPAPGGIPLYSSTAQN
jgi:hypothetical protein